MGNAERVALWIGGGVLGVVVLAVALVLLVGDADVVTYPPDSSPGVVQQYLNALRERDAEAAETWLSADVLREMKRNGQSPVDYCVPQRERIVQVERVQETGDRAFVTLEIEDTRGSGFSFDRYSWEQTVSLVREDGQWKIDDPYVCL